MSRLPLWPTALVVLLAVHVAPQRIASAELPPDSDLVHIEVVVSDRRGEPVTDLGADDFEVLIDGLATPVVSLVPPAAVAAQPAAASERQLSLLLYVDNLNADLRRRAEVFDRLGTATRQHVGELDRVMVVAGHGSSVSAEQRFTGDPQLVIEALDRIEESVPLAEGGSELAHLLSEIERMLRPAQNQLDPASERNSQTVAQQLQAYAALQRQRTQATCDRLKEAVDLLAGLPGRRVIVYVGAGMPLNPGEDLLAAVTSARPSIREEGALDSPNNSMPVELERGMGQTVTALGRYASLNDVAFYSVDIGRRRAASGDGSANIVIADAGSVQLGEGFNRPAADFGRRSNIDDSVRIIASETGGLLVRKYQAIDLALARLMNDREGAYTLAFARPDGAAGSPHSIEIRTGRRRLDVRHRRSFRTPGDDDRIVEQLRTAMMGGETSNPLAASIISRDAGPPEGDSYDVHLSIQVPVENLALQPLELSHKAQVTVFLAASDGDLSTSPIQKVVVPITIPNDEMLASMGRSIDYELEMRVLRGREQLALAVHDDIDSRLSILTLTAPQPGEGNPPGR